MAVTCPNCGFAPVAHRQCPRCGVVVESFRVDLAARARAAADGPAAPLAPPPRRDPSRTNGFAVASLALGILWVVGIGSLLAVIFGHLSLRQIKQSNGRETGRGFAIAGLTLGWIGLGYPLLWLMWLALGLALATARRW